MGSEMEKDWEKRYRERDTPWEEEEPSSELLVALRAHAGPDPRVLEVGCGLGTNALWLASHGYRIDATDVSQRCIEQARARSAPGPGAPNFFVMDAIRSPIDATYDVVVDRGCFHSFSRPEARGLFGRKMSERLVENGIWITVCGNADNPDDLDRRRADEYPRLSLREIACAAEPFFEVIEVRRGRFGVRNDFLSWVVVARKRRFFYEGGRSGETDAEAEASRTW
jgi:methyl halide transferase